MVSPAQLAALLCTTPLNALPNTPASGAATTAWKLNAKMRSAMPVLRIRNGEASAMFRLMAMPATNALLRNTSKLPNTPWAAKASPLKIAMKTSSVRARKRPISAIAGIAISNPPMLLKPWICV